MKIRFHFPLHHFQFPPSPKITKTQCRSANRRDHRVCRSTVILPFMPWCAFSGALCRFLICFVHSPARASCSVVCGGLGWRRVLRQRQCSGKCQLPWCLFEFFIPKLVLTVVDFEIGKGRWCPVEFSSGGQAWNSLIFWVVCKRRETLGLINFPFLISLHFRIYCFVGSEFDWLVLFWIPLSY